jgi:hypothetical protein
MKHLTTVLLFGLFFFSAMAQAQQTLPAVFQQGAVPVLDGIANEDCWQSAPLTNQFISAQPVFGQLPQQNTSVRLFYTSEAIWVSATCAGTQVRDDGSLRDQVNQADWFSVAFDTWNDDQHAFEFVVTARGLQQEKRRSGVQDGLTFDAVWYSAVAVQAEGWSVEMCIPFTALRFPAGGGQQWGLQLSRFERSSGYLYTWSPQKPEIKDIVWQYGLWEGLQDIQQLKRRSLAIHSLNDLVIQNPNLYYSSYGSPYGQNLVAIDAKIGLGSATTLDINILPPFSYVANEILLPAFSNPDLNEKIPQPRQFETEEIGINTKGNIFWRYPTLDVNNLFNRVRFTTPIIAYGFNNGPTYNTTRLTTRFKNNVGLSVSNSIMGAAGIQYFDVATSQSKYLGLQKMGNYTFFTLDKALKNNSWISFSNGTLLGGKEINTNISSMNWQLRDKSNQYAFSGTGRMNIEDFTGQHFTVADFEMKLAKVNGNWTWSLEHQSANKVLFSYALGNQYSSGYRAPEYSRATLEKRRFNAEKRHIYQKKFLHISQMWNNLPNRSNDFLIATGIEWQNSHFQQLRFSLGGNPFYTLNPISVSGLNNFLLRRTSPSVQAMASFVSDNRKRLFYEISVQLTQHVAGEHNSLFLSAQPVWALNKHWRFSLNNQFYTNTNLLQSIASNTGKYIFKEFNSLYTRHQLQTDWTIRPKWTLYSRVIFGTDGYVGARAVALNADRSLVPADVPLSPNVLKTIFNLGLGMQWVFKGTSQLRFYHTFNNAYYQGYLNQSAIPNFEFNGFQETQSTLEVIWNLDVAKKRFKKPA